MEDVEGGVVLEEEVPVNSNATNVFEHMRELHVLWIGPESIEAAMKLTNWEILLGQSCGDSHVVVIDL